MIIQCAQCSSKFRLDDSKVTESGIKVRCSKCKHIFVVKKDVPAEEPDLDRILQGLQTAGSEERSAAAPEAATPTAEAPAPTPLPADDAGPFSFAAEEEGVSFGIPPAAPQEREPAPVLPSPAAEDEFVSFAAPRQEDGFFGETPGVASGVAEEAVPGGAVPEEPAFSYEEENVFGDVSPEVFAAATAVDTSRHEEGGESAEITFEFEDETDADSLGLAPDEKVEESFDFGEIDFGIEDSGEGESTDVSTPSLEFPSPEKRDSVAPAEEVPPPVAPVPEEVPPVAVPFGEDDLPPLTISSRKKGSSFLPAVVIAVSVLVIIALAGGGFYFFKEGPAALDRLGIGFVAQWLGMETREEGGIGIDKVRGAYLKNVEVGEVFVIRGEAVNNYRKPRASIQVKGALLGSGGQVLLQKIAFCGNNLTDEQVQTLPVAKIDAAMNNQFGDSLANLGVPPGKRIPFVVVLRNVPKDAVDYSVEMVGSTVASQ
ncbi:DUF3426 domain-containing protein [Geobacter pickeringii]|uniref:Zinc finger/thioredoxin putative domain-containing protein n=1 Tax=Geobacter pickeringii TaxID=345632 RepID=A0A0B5B803_9BACT|nr:DUF3426 domain-containing protein [Geobacter pickeringii]AJE02723.1 hypothetical protein GPICK_04490 [Geobacter pickeringii]